MTTFLECFNIIIMGDKEASRKAARQVRKLVYEGIKNGDKFCLTRFLGYAIIKLLKPPALILSNQNTAGF